MSPRKRHLLPDGVLDLASAIPGQSRDKLLHLLTCSRCRMAALELCAREFPGETASPHEKHHLTPIEADRAGAAALLAELLEAPDPRATVEADERFQSPALATLLLERCADESASSDRHLEFLAGLACVIAAQPGPAWFKAPLREELQAEAIGYFAEARRIRGDLKGAEEILLEASGALAESPADSRERATLLFRLAAVRMDQGSTDEALALYMRVSSLFEEVGDLAWLARARASEGRLRFSLREAETALPPLLEAIDLTPPEDLVSTALNRFCLALCYRDLGNETRAREEIDKIRELLPRLPESMQQLPELLTKLEALQSP